MSLIKTVSLMLILSALVVMAGYLFGNGSLTMLFILLGIVLAMNLWAYWGSDGVVKRMAGAREVSEQEEPRLHHMVSEVARMADMPKPRVAVIENESPNAFATGRSPKRALVAVTTGLRRILDEEELRGVIAHEMAHIKNRDMLTMTIVAVLAGVISLIGTIAMWGMLFGGFGGGHRGGGGGYGAIVGIVGLIVVIVVMPLAAKMVSFTISRTREYSADETGARIIRNPNGLANALMKLENTVHRRPMKASSVNEAMAHLYIVNPLGPRSAHRSSEGGSMFVGLFSTHPPVEDRVRKLRALILY